MGKKKSACSVRNDGGRQVWVAHPCGFFFEKYLRLRGDIPPAAKTFLPIFLSSAVPIRRANR
jgi:hypothetical protein